MKKITILLFLFVSMKVFAAPEEFNLQSETSFHPTHQNRLSFMLGLNPSINKAADITNFAFSFAKKMEDYWLDSNLLITNGLFQKVTTNNSAATGLTDADLFDQKSPMITIGAGLGRETRYIQTLLPFENTYEYMAANITYNRFKEKVSSYTFSGPGILAKFQAYKRFSDYMSFGGQFLYTLASIKRGQNVDTETSSARSLTYSTLTVGFDLSFYL